MLLEVEFLKAKLFYLAIFCTSFWLLHIERKFSHRTQFETFFLYLSENVFISRKSNHNIKSRSNVVSIPTFFFLLSLSFYIA